MEGSANADFDLGLVSQYFSDSKDENGDIRVADYVKGYRELCKFFNLFGTAFSFVTSDVLAKCDILDSHMKTSLDNNQEHYTTVRSMLTYEVEQDIIATQKGKNGSRTFLRLHRALDFCSQLLESIIDLKNEEKLSTKAWEVYQRTLSNFHSWFVRRAVGVAMYILPTRQSLKEKMGNPSDEEAERTMRLAVTSMRTAYDIVQDLYTEKNLHSLP